MTTLSSLALLLLLVLVVYLLKPPSIPGIPTATPCLPLVGNAIHFGIDPVNFLVRQRARHGDVFLVNLAIIRVVFFLGPEGTNAILKGTEKGGISFWEALRYVIGGAVDKGPPLPLLLIAVPLITLPSHLLVVPISFHLCIYSSILDRV